MIELTRAGDCLIAQLSGELDHYSAAEVRVAIDNEFEKDMPARLIFDLSNMTFMDSSGIGVVMGRYRRIVEHGGSVGFVGINSYIDKLIKVSGLLKIIPQYGSLEEAVIV